MRRRYDVVLALCSLGCQPAPPGVQRSPTHAATPSAKPASPAASPPLAPSPPEPAAAESLDLRVVAENSGPGVEVFDQGVAPMILSRSCVATVEGDTLVPGRYPLPAPECREPLAGLWGNAPLPWLVAGPDVWQKAPAGNWQRRATFTNAARVLLPTRIDQARLALVVPVKRPTRSTWLPSASFELRALPGSRLAAPNPTRVQPSPLLDDFMGACSTTTRLAEPRALHVTHDQRVLVFGTECDRTSLASAVVVEEWLRGSAHSSIRKLSSADEMLMDAQINSDDDIWLAAERSLHHFDGSAWSTQKTPMPGRISALAVSRAGTIWLLVDRALWWREREEWQHQELSLAFGAPRAIYVDSSEAIWVATESTLLSSRALRGGQLCATECAEFWQEERRARRLSDG